MKRTIIPFTLIICILALLSCDNKPGKPNHGIESINQSFRKFIDHHTLSKAEFENFDPLNFKLLLKGTYTYILNKKDARVAFFKNNVPGRVYNHKGPGPLEMISPSTIFTYNDEYIGIVDTTKLSVILFDNNLNAKEEISISPSLRKLANLKGKYFAFGDFGNHCFAQLDNRFEIIQSFVDRKVKSPYKGVLPTALYMGYLLDNGMIADTSWQYLKSECCINIIEPVDGSEVFTLQWPHPYPPTQEDISSHRNFYSSFYVNTYGDYYIVQNEYVKSIGTPIQLYLYIFNDKGILVKQLLFPHYLIEVMKSNSDNRLFCLYDEEDLSFVEIEALVE